MVIRRNDSRRRRALIDEANQLPDPNPATAAVREPARPRKTARKKSRREYRPAAARRHQPKATDWIPKRGSAVAFFLLALGLLFSLLAAGDWLAGSAWVTGDWRQRLSLTGNQPLSLWFSTVLLLVSSLASLQIHALRQHRSNDYRGTYRIWLWFSGLLLVASINCVLDLTGLAAGFFQGEGRGHWWWLLPAVQLLALGAIFARGLVEVRQSPASLAVIGLVWIAYSTALVLRLPGVETQIVGRDGTIAAGLNLFATFALFSGLTVYSRNIYLRANGLAGSRIRRKKTRFAAAKPVPAGGTPEDADAAASGRSRKKVGSGVRKSRPLESPEPRPQTAETSPPAAVPKSPSLVDRFGPKKKAAEPAPTPPSRPAPSKAQESMPDFTPVEDDGSSPEDHDFELSDDRQDSDDRADGNFRRLSKADRKRMKRLRQQEAARRAA